ncbi:MAG: hypothetical protein U5L45_15845 [Saprospiraceae bacterium]|nr:hypothetical protein [Saprospiraceae bacterium]
MAKVSSGSMVLGAGVVIGGFLWFNQLQADLWRNINWKFKRFTFDGIGGDLQSVRFIAAIEIDNDTVLEVTIEKFNGFVYYKGSPLIPIKSTETTTIQAHTLTTLNYTVPLGFDNLKTVFGSTWAEIKKNIAASLKPGNYRLKGTIFINIQGILKEIELDEQFSYS